jgi:hypothetical protein
VPVSPQHLKRQTIELAGCDNEGCQRGLNAPQVDPADGGETNRRRFDQHVYYG